MLVDQSIYVWEIFNINLSSLISGGWDQDIKNPPPQFKTGEWCVEAFVGFILDFREKWFFDLILSKFEGQRK